MIFIVNTSRKRFLSGDLNANIVIDVSKKEIKTLIKFDRYRLKIIFWCSFPSRWEAKRVLQWSSAVLHHCSLIKEIAICHSIKQTCRVLLSREMKYCCCQHCTEDLFSKIAFKMSSQYLALLQKRILLIKTKSVVFFTKTRTWKKSGIEIQMNRNLLNMKILTDKILERNRDWSSLRRNILFTNGLVKASGKDISVIRDWNVSLKYARVFASVCSLPHSWDTPERGFSINKLLETHIYTIWEVTVLKDELEWVGGVLNFNIPRDLISDG